MRCYLPLEKHVFVEIGLIHVVVHQVIFLNFSFVFSLFSHCFPLKRPNLNPLHPIMLCQVWLKLALCFWRRSLNFSNEFCPFHYFLQLEKRVALHLMKLKFSSPKDALCQVWSKLAQWIWRRWKCEKFYTDRWMDGQMTGNQKSSFELSAQVIKLKFDPSHFALIVMTIYHTCIPNNITY